MNINYINNAAANILLTVGCMEGAQKQGDDQGNVEKRGPTEGHKSVKI